jgi:hypothetical protein
VVEVSGSRSSLSLRGVDVEGAVVVVVVLRLWRFSWDGGGSGACCVVDEGEVEVFNVAFLSRDEERRAVSLAWRSVAMRWARGTSSMRRKSRVEAATLGSEDEGSVVGVVLAIFCFVLYCISACRFLALFVCGARYVV